MEMSNGKLILIGFVVFIIAVLGLYIPYNNERNEQKQIERDISDLRQRVLLLNLNKNNLLKEIAQLNVEIESAIEQSEIKGAEIEDLQNDLDELINQREIAVAAALSNLKLIRAVYMNENGSIDYSELLFSLADRNGIALNSISIAEDSDININGVDYHELTIDFSASGTRDNILAFITQITDNDNFGTAFFDNILINTPHPLSEDEKTGIYNDVLSELKLDAISRFTIDEVVEFIVLGLKNVTDSSLDVPVVEEMAEEILSALEDLVATEYEVPLAYDLAEIIKLHISEWIIDEVIGTLAIDISNAITNGSDQTALIELYGEDIAALLGGRLTNILPAEIAELLKEYVSSEIELEMTAAVLPFIEEDAGDIAANRIKQLEASEGEISLVIYSYREVQ
jgi:hypothetical protein